MPPIQKQNVKVYDVTFDKSLFHDKDITTFGRRGLKWTESILKNLGYELSTRKTINDLEDSSPLSQVERQFVHGKERFGGVDVVFYKKRNYNAVITFDHETGKQTLATNDPELQRIFATISKAKRFELDIDYLNSDFDGFLRRAMHELGYDISKLKKSPKDYVPATFTRDKKHPHGTYSPIKNGNVIFIDSAKSENRLFKDSKYKSGVVLEIWTNDPDFMKQLEMYKKDEFTSKKVIPKLVKK